MAHWDQDYPPPEELRDTIEALEGWATRAVDGRGLADRVRVRPEELTALVAATPELIDIALDAEYLADRSVAIEDLEFLVGHELGEAKLNLEGSELTGKAREHAADRFAAELVGTDAAVTAVRRHRDWYARTPNPLQEDSRTHPSTEDRIRHLQGRI